MKRKRMLFVTFFLVGALIYVNIDDIHGALFNSPVIKGEAAILIDEQTGRILYSKNMNKKVYPASTTKLLTALVVLDHSSLDETVTVGEEIYLQMEGEVRAGLTEGQVITVEDLLSAMLLQSGNDAARSLAVYIAKKESGSELASIEAINQFAQLMNQKALEIGATHSHFVNPHGLHDPNHYTTAKDLSKIARAAKKHEVIANLVKLDSYTAEQQTYKNRNQLLQIDSDYYYKDATGLKTGFTNEAGYCLVASAKRGNQELITVVLHSGEESVWKDAISLLDYGFGKYF